MVERIRDYSVIKKIGEGGMGTVYLAADSMLDRNVAIKVLNPALTEDPKFVDRFRQEAKVQSSLVHPNVVTLYTFFIERGEYCMVMEYASGETLKSIIDREGPMAEDRAIAIVTKILDAVGYAHDQGIIHRDIKPSNIMIGPNDTVKIMDFGIAKILGDKGLTRTGAKLGTIYYMSPEQVRAQKDIDRRTDIYSIGVTLFEMLTGRVPLNTETESEFDLMQEIVEAEFPAIRSLNPRVSLATEENVRRATTKDRDARWQSCHDFRRALLHENGPGGRSAVISGFSRQSMSGSSSPNSVASHQGGIAVPLPGLQFPVSGWLLVFVILLTLGGAVSMLYALSLQNELLRDLHQTFRNAYNSSDVRTVRDLYLTVDILVPLFGFYVGFLILTRHKQTLVYVQRYLMTLLGICLLKPLIALMAGLKPTSANLYTLKLFFEMVGTGLWVFVWSRYFKQSQRVQAFLGGGGSPAMASPRAPLAITKRPSFKLAAYSIGLLAMLMLIYGTSSLSMSWLVLGSALMTWLAAEVIFRQGNIDWLKSVQPNASAAFVGLMLGFLPTFFSGMLPLYLRSGHLGTVFLISLVGTGLFGGALPAFLTWDKNRRTENATHLHSQVLTLPKLKLVARIACYVIAARFLIHLLLLLAKSDIGGLWYASGWVYGLAIMVLAPMLYILLEADEKFGEVSTVLFLLSGGMIALSDLFIAMQVVDVLPPRYSEIGEISQALITNSQLCADLLLGLGLILFSRGLRRRTNAPMPLVVAGYLNAGASLAVGMSGTYGILGQFSTTVLYLMWAVEFVWALLFAQWLTRNEAIGA